MKSSYIISNARPYYNKDAQLCILKKKKKKGFEYPQEFAEGVNGIGNRESFSNDKRR